MKYLVVTGTATTPAAPVVNTVTGSRAEYVTAHMAYQAKTTIKGAVSRYCREDQLEETVRLVNQMTGYKPVATTPKPAEYGLLGLYSYDGVTPHKVAEYTTVLEANAAYRRLAEAKKRGEISIVEPRYLVCHVAFADGRIYTYFVFKKHKVGTKLVVETADGPKTVTVAKAAWWATREELERSCPFWRYKVARPAKR